MDPEPDTATFAALVDDMTCVVCGGGGGGGGVCVCVCEGWGRGRRGGDAPRSESETTASEPTGVAIDTEVRGDGGSGSDCGEMRFAELQRVWPAGCLWVMVEVVEVVYDSR